MKFTSLLLSISLLISQVGCTSLQPSNEYNRDNVVQVQKKENDSSSKLKTGLIVIGVVAILAALLARKVVDDVSGEVIDGI